MTCGYRNSAGTDLDSLFLVSNQNAGALGFKNSGGVDLGNLYTHETTLGYSVGYRSSAGTDIGYLRGKELANPVWGTTGVSNIVFDQYVITTQCSDSGYDGGTWYYDCDECQNTYVVCQLNPTLSNYMASRSYTFLMDCLLWTTTGDSKGGACYAFYPEESLAAATNSKGSISATGNEVRYEFPSSNAHDASHLTGNRHNQNDFENEGSRWRLETPFVQGGPYIFRVYWGVCWMPLLTKFKLRYMVIDNQTQQNTGWYYSEEFTYGTTWE